VEVNGHLHVAVVLPQGNNICPLKKSLDWSSCGDEEWSPYFCRELNLSSSLYPVNLLIAVPQLFMMLLTCQNYIKSDNCTLLRVTYFSDTCPVRSFLTFQHTSRLCASDSYACADEGFTRILKVIRTILCNIQTDKAGRKLLHEKCVIYWLYIMSWYVFENIT
jgi:hypothetical protein